MVLLTIPAPFKYNDEQCGTGEIGGSAGIATVTGISELAVEVTQCAASSRRSGAALRPRCTGSEGDGLGFGCSELASDMGVGNRLQQSQIGIDDGIGPGQPLSACRKKRGNSDLEGQLEVGDVLPRDRIALGGERH